MVFYTKELLNTICERDCAELLSGYDKLNRDTRIEYKCICGKNSIKTFRYIVNNSGLYCKECSTKNALDKCKQTFLEKYGVEFIFQNKEIQEKTKKTMVEKYGTTCSLQNSDIKQKAKNTILKRYGVEHPLQNNEIKEKQKETNIKKHGVEYPSQNKEIRNKINITNIEKYGFKCSLQSTYIKEKANATNLHKYGNICSLKNSDIKQKAKNTILKRYGVEHPIQNNEIKEKIKKTTLERYGTEYATQNEVIKNNIISTNLKKYGTKFPIQSNILKKNSIMKYGTEYPSQSIHIQEKIQKNAKKYKEYKMPSGVIRKVQGYEPFALDILMQLYNEDQVKTNRKEVPRVQYTVDDKNKYYFPDIFIPHENKIIEVKSNWTYKCKKDNIEHKKNACIAQGYLYELWCFDSKGNKIDCN